MELRIFYLFLIVISVTCISCIESHGDDGFNVEDEDFFAGRSKRQANKKKKFTVDNFFENFGYLDEKSTTNITSHSDADIQRATREFQKMVGLPVTGVLDKRTIRKMKSPRCGVKDVLPPSKRGVSRDQPQAFHTLGLKWPRNEVTWKIVGYTGQLAQSIQRRAYYDAFRKWSDVTPLVFREVRGGNADILISYARYNHGDGSSFDGKGGTLAHAFFPGKQPIAGDTHFDDDEKWTMGTKEGTNLEIVAAHEFGHAIGMSHSNIQEALMAPYYQGYDPNFQLHRDDIAGIQSLYGRPRNTPRPTARPRPTPRPTAPSGGGSNCDLKFDVIFNGHDNRLYAVRGRNLYRFNRDGVGIESGYPKNARKVYQRFPKSPAAAVQDRYRRVYVFKDKRVFRYTGYRLDAGYPKRTIGKKNFFRYPQAALMWYDGRIYLFKGDKYSIWRDDYKEPPPGYPKTITSFWRGVPNNVEAAVRWNRYTYFFKGQNYVKLNDRSRSKYFGYPKKKAAPWLGCGQRTPK